MQENVHRWLELLVNANLPPHRIQAVLRQELKGRDVHVHVETRQKH